MTSYRYGIQFTENNSIKALRLLAGNQLIIIVHYTCYRGPSDHHRHLVVTRPAFQQLHPFLYPDKFPSQRLCQPIQRVHILSNNALTHLPRCLKVRLVHSPVGSHHSLAHWQVDFHRSEDRSGVVVLAVEAQLEWHALVVLVELDHWRRVCFLHLQARLPHQQRDHWRLDH